MQNYFKKLIIGALICGIVLFGFLRVKENNAIVNAITAGDEVDEPTLSVEEQKVLKEQERLSKLVPYEGMDEESIAATIVGEADTIWERNIKGEIITRHYWYADNGRDKVLVVDCVDGKVSTVKKYYTTMYWDENGMPYFDRESPYNPSSEMQIKKVEKKHNTIASNYYYISYDPYDVEQYNDPDDFADEWAEEFGDGDYDDGYDDAYEYWEDYYAY